jgi:hypothetical protein
MDPLKSLKRSDKWFLGGGKGAIYAPPFPRFLTTPGFWDECYLADLKIPRLFTVLFTDRSGDPVRLSSRLTEWRPDRLVIQHEGTDVRLRETRCITEGNAWVSKLELLSGGPLFAFLWSLLDVRPAGDGAPWQGLVDVSVEDDGLTARWDTAWPLELEPDRTAVESEAIRTSQSSMGAPLPIWLSFGANAPRISWTVNLAQRHDDSPLYETSLIPQKLRHGKLPGDFKLRVGTEPIEGLAHLVQQYELSTGKPLVVGCGSGLDAGKAQASLRDVLDGDAVERSEQSWRRYFESVPAFESSDPYLTTAYWYRWYGLRLNTVQMQSLPIAGGNEKFGPYVTEGIGFFRNFVTYSAQAHLREVSWMHDPTLAVGILDNLARVQREDGSYPGHNYSCRPARDFYHADFGTPVRQLHALHPGSVNRDHLASLRRYADYFLRYRTTSKDPAGPTLYDVFDQNETGQEYMSRYQFASEAADTWASFRVQGVDATVYMVALFEALDYFRAADSSYRVFAEGARRGLLETSFDPVARFFCDVRTDGTRSWARPLTGLYPFMVGMSNPEDLAKWLPEFDLPCGFPATAASDPTFSADGEWKERRLNCPWNGRSWPMANSHFVDAVAATPMRQEAGSALLKAVRLLFHNDDPTRPNCYEHYDPIDGTPALYRGYDDYMHSWIVDLILRHAVGVKPGSETVDPLPMDVDRIECSRIPHPKGEMNVRLERDRPPVVEFA